MNSPDSLLFTPAQVRELDRLAIARQGVTGSELMQRAAESVFNVAQSRYPKSRRWRVLCGAGNNAGDGYLIAVLAREAGLDVGVVALANADELNGDAALAAARWQDSGGAIEPFQPRLVHDADLLIDALLGTGLTRDVSGSWQDAISAVNNSVAPTIAVDLPSGLHGETGRVMGAAVEADCTVTFIGRKSGLYLGSGPDCAGDVVFAELGVDTGALNVGLPVAALVTEAQVAGWLPSRPATAHKGAHGHVLVVGGNEAMPGAARLAGEASLRAGAGLVTVATRPKNVATICSARPELMVIGVEQAADLDQPIARATVIAIGPGLGTDRWSQALLERTLAAGKPTVVDADALNLLAASPRHSADWVLTPHPGEAGRLLSLSSADVQADRLAALLGLQERYGGVGVLKGSGSLIGQAGRVPWLVDAGNPGMATAGMGDVLTGTIAGLLAQFPAASPHDVVAAAVWAHARAGDAAAVDGQRGLIASDVLNGLRACLNP